MIRILADKYLYRIQDFMPSGVTCTLFDPAKGLPHWGDTPAALLTRTTTKLNAHTLATAPESLQFIGTGSAGTDHVDINYLEAQGIPFSNAPGCNARSVGEYVAVSLLLWAETFGYSLTNFSVGLIGAGHTGSQVQQLLQQLGVTTVAYDPPRAEKDSSFSSASRDDVLACDILSFHVPLTSEGHHPTHHWLNAQTLANRRFACIINASRGGVVDEAALCAAFDEGRIDHFIVDVWEQEPTFMDETARRAFIKTPHIAGYSVQAKLNASRIIVEAMAQALTIEAPLPAITESPQLQQQPGQFWSLADALTFLHPIEDYQTRLQMLVGRAANDKAKQFNHIRANHPLRHELHTFRHIFDNKKILPLAAKTLVYDT